MAGKVSVTAGTGTITVMGAGGTPNEAVEIVVSQGGTQVETKSGNLDANGTGSYTFQLQPGTYDVSVTAPSPGGTVRDFPGQVVS
jgi:hypothetical protein